MESRNPDFDVRVRESFASQPMMKTLGVELMNVQPGQIIFQMQHHDAVTQQHGFIHGGCLAAILDSVCGYAALSVMQAKAEVLTIELKSNFLAPALGERYVFRGTVVKPGRTIIVTEGKAYSVNGQEEKLVTMMTATMMVVMGRDDIKPRQ